LVVVLALFCLSVYGAKKTKVESYCEWSAKDGVPVPVSHGGLGQLRGNGHGKGRKFIISGDFRNDDDDHSAYGDHDDCKTIIFDGFVDGPGKGHNDVIYGCAAHTCDDDDDHRKGGRDDDDDHSKGGRDDDDDRKGGSGHGGRDDDDDGDDKGYGGSGDNYGNEESAYGYNGYKRSILGVQKKNNKKSHKSNKRRDDDDAHRGDDDDYSSLSWKLIYYEDADRGGGNGGEEYDRNWHGSNEAQKAGGYADYERYY